MNEAVIVRELTEATNIAQKPTPTVIQYDHHELGRIHCHWTETVDDIAMVATNNDAIVRLALQWIDNSEPLSDARSDTTSNCKTATLVELSTFGQDATEKQLSNLLFAVALDIFFSNNPGCDKIYLSASAIGSSDKSHFAKLYGTYVIRNQFYQSPTLWSLVNCVPLQIIHDSTHSDSLRTHPERPPQPNGEFYRRFVPGLGKTLSFRVINPDSDLDLFHFWMNQPRVAKMWELDKPKQELHDYLREREADPHIFSVVGEFDGEAFGYFEVYWTKEDRLGPYYDAGDYDRGFHLLVGNRQFLGRKYFNAWFTGLTHAIFLQEPRTERIMGEPRADNRGLLQYTATLSAYHILKEFDFPHKRAALVECTRQRFFNEIVLP